MPGSERSRSPVEDVERTERIRLLNDHFRATFEGGKVMLTEGLKGHAGEQLQGGIRTAPAWGFIMTVDILGAKLGP
jgi:hypothetical protein